MPSVLLLTRVPETTMTMVVARRQLVLEDTARRAYAWAPAPARRTDARRAQLLPSRRAHRGPALRRRFLSKTAFFGKAYLLTHHTDEATGSATNYDAAGPYMGYRASMPPLVLPMARATRRTRANAGPDLVFQTPHGLAQLDGPPIRRLTGSRVKAPGKRPAPRARPFMTWVSFPDPHHPFDAPEPWAKLHDPADVDLPPHRRRTFEGRPWWHEAVLTAEPTGSAKSAEIRKNYSRMSKPTPRPRSSPTPMARLR